MSVSSVTDPRQTVWEASAYRLADRIILHPWAIEGPSEGWRFFIEPLVSLPVDCGPEAVGTAARRVLQASVIDAEHPPNRRELFNRVIECSGYSSVEEFVSNSSACKLMLRTSSPAAGISIAPSRNGTGVQIEDAAVRYALGNHAIQLPPDVGDDELGIALFRGFEMCE